MLNIWELSKSRPGPDQELTLTLSDTTLHYGHSPTGAEDATDTSSLTLPAVAFAFSMERTTTEIQASYTVAHTPAYKVLPKTEEQFYQLESRQIVEAHGWYTKIVGTADHLTCLYVLPVKGKQVMHFKTYDASDLVAAKVAETANSLAQEKELTALLIANTNLTQEKACLFLMLSLSAVTSRGSTASKGVKKNLKRKLHTELDTLEGIPLIGGVVKGARKFIPGASSSDEMVDLMEEQVETSKTALEQMQLLAKDMLDVKHQIEEAAAIKRQGEQLLKDLTDAKYGKVAIGIAEKISAISLNPSDYIPSLESTDNLKRSCSFSFYREKALLGSIDSFSNRGGKFFGKKPPKGLNELCKDIQQELLRTDQIKIASKESNHQLIPIYREQIKQLEAQNKKIDQTLLDPRFQKDDPLKFFQLESLKHKNIIRMGKLVEKINKLTCQSEDVSSADKTAIAELYGEQLYQDLLRHTIEQKRQRRYRR